MLAKILVLAAILGFVWAFAKLAKKVKIQSQELKEQKAASDLQAAKKAAEKEQDVIDLEVNPDTGSFEEKK